jgi:hypothetical protein
VCVTGSDIAPWAVLRGFGRKIRGMKTFRLTHLGWFGLCPVKLSDPSACGENYGPLIEPRWLVVVPLFWLSEFIFGLCFLAMEACGRQPPGWPVKITGRIDPPEVIEVPDEDLAA